MNNLIKYRKYTYTLSILIIIVSIFAISRFGLNLGIDFTGGTLMELGCTERTENCSVPDVGAVREALGAMNMKNAIVQSTDTQTIIVRYAASTEDQNSAVLNALENIAPGIQTLRVDFIGASISQQLKDNAISAIITAIIVILFYIAWVFRKVSFFVSSWVYGFGAVVALLHDVLIVIGVFAVLGHLSDIKIGVSFIAALLTVLGYSVNDTIVVYDRVRENILRHGRKHTFPDLVSRSIRETIARSMNTSLTVVVVLLAVILFGGAALFHFALALLIGVVAGTYSSIFVASAILVTFYLKNHTQEHKQ